MSHATARTRQAGTSFESQTVTGRQRIWEPGLPDLSTLRPRAV